MFSNSFSKLINLETQKPKTMYQLFYAILPLPTRNTQTQLGEY